MLLCINVHNNDYNYKYSLLKHNSCIYVFIFYTPSLHEPSAETVGSCDIDSDESGDIVSWRCTANAGVSIICLVDGIKLEDCICKFNLPPSFLPHSVTHSVTHSLLPSSLSHSLFTSSLTQSLTLYFLPHSVTHSLLPPSLSHSLFTSSLTQSLTLYFLPHSVTHSSLPSFLPFSLIVTIPYTLTPYTIFHQ